VEVVPRIGQSRRHTRRGLKLDETDTRRLAGGLVLGQPDGEHALPGRLLKKSLQLLFSHIKR
jgi:hypothetical protein